MSLLLLAEQWGCPPWEIIGRESSHRERLQWYLRWQYFTTQRALARKQ